jgi:hypothetical protein
MVSTNFESLSMGIIRWLYFNRKLTRFFLLVGFGMVFLPGMNGQQVTLTEGKQKIQIYNDGSYHILDPEGTGVFTLNELNHLEGSQKLVGQTRIIEAEYFVQIFNLQKETDLLNITRKRAKSEKNKSLAQDCSNKIKEIRSKMKDISGLYDNALYNQKIARKYIDQPSSVDDKKLSRLLTYIENKEYLFKTIKNRNNPPTEFIIFEPQKKEVSAEAALQANPAETPLVKADKTLVKTNGCNLVLHTSEQQFTADHEFEPLFVYTPDRLKIHLKEEDLIFGATRIRKLNKEYFMDLQVWLKSKDAAKSYGNIPEGNFVRIEFVNGIRLNAKVKESVLGKIEEYSGKVKYTCTFSMDQEMIKQMGNLPVDNIGIMWSSGFEKYEVYEVDVFMRQIKCFQKFKN